MKLSLHRHLQLVSFVLLCSGKALAFAEPVLVTMFNQSFFVDVKSTNPFGFVSAPGSGGAHLNVTASLSFLFPTDENQTAPGRWTTTGSGWITANDVTVNFEGPVMLDMRGMVGTTWSPQGSGSFGASISNGLYQMGMSVFTASPYQPSIPDLSSRNIFNLPDDGYLVVTGAYTDVEKIRTTFAVVPEPTYHAAIIGFSVLGVVTIRRLRGVRTG